MRKIITGLGIVLIFLGFIVVLYHNMPQQIVRDSDFVRAQDSWHIARGDFKKGENLSVGFIPGYNWAWPPQDDTTIDDIRFERVKVFYIKVTDTTTQNYTEFALILIIPPPPYDPGKITLHPKIKVTHHGGITVEDFPREIGGIVGHDGTYTVDTELYPDLIQNIYIENNQTHTEWILPVPPSELRLTRVTKENTYPYRNLLPLGLPVIGTGVVALIFGIRKGKHGVTHKKTRTGSIKRPARSNVKKGTL